MHYPSPNIKESGAYYTPDFVVSDLVEWATMSQEDASLLDPACGDGRFLRWHRNAVGIDVDPVAVVTARSRCPFAEIVEMDFFKWATSTSLRFDAVIGNPPFIRYQTYAGAQRDTALSYCSANAVTLSALSSAWAFFIVGAATLLKPGGRLAFVVPAEIGNSVYAKRVVDFLVSSFASVQLFVPQEKLFPRLSEECWLLKCDGYSRKAANIDLFETRSFVGSATQWAHSTVSLEALQKEEYRLRFFLLPSDVQALYERKRVDSSVKKLGELADVGIGYVTGANDFFHLRPSLAKQLRIPEKLLHSTVRANRDLIATDISKDIVQRWIEQDRPFLLLHLAGQTKLPVSVRRYLESEAGITAREAFKCRTRKPWYVVPDVKTPDAFLSVMSHIDVKLSTNSAGCSCTNTVHAVTVKNKGDLRRIVGAWDSTLRKLSCEIEGHQLGGGMLKIEPVEARKILISSVREETPEEVVLLEHGLRILRKWRNADVT